MTTPLDTVQAWAGAERRRRCRAGIAPAPRFLGIRPFSFLLDREQWIEAVPLRRPPARSFTITPDTDVRGSWAAIVVGAGAGGHVPGSATNGSFGPPWCWSTSRTGGGSRPPQPPGTLPAPPEGSPWPASYRAQPAERSPW